MPPLMMNCILFFCPAGSLEFTQKAVQEPIPGCAAVARLDGVMREENVVRKQGHDTIWSGRAVDLQTGLG
ncbi:hypothetical protein WS75_07425 [Burkholderia sp. FL-7-2-10-S1-D7]|nr:hypothetical protein WS75_07425 [Burkholderia sp. FL-7-2-10-S1-D7]